jgi:hypothetical protein
MSLHFIKSWLRNPLDMYSVEMNAWLIFGFMVEFILGTRFEPEYMQASLFVNLRSRYLVVLVMSIFGAIIHVLCKWKRKPI